MDSGFDELEQKVRKAADVVRRLRQENEALRKEAETRRAAPPPEDGRKAEALGKELEGLRGERDEIRRRIARLVQVLDALDAQE